MKWNNICQGYQFMYHNMHFNFCTILIVYCIASHILNYNNKILRTNERNRKIYGECSLEPITKIPLERDRAKQSEKGFFMRLEMKTISPPRDL